MAYVNSEWKPCVDPMTTVAQIVRALRGAVADEMSAANLYSAMIDDLKAGGVSGEVIDRIREIMADEENHAGSLLYVVGLLDKTIAENMEKGAKGD